MSLYKNILFPFDAKLKSEESFSYAIELAKSNESNLIFLYAHRLDTDSERKLVSASDLREEVRMSADDILDQLKRNFALDGYIDYEFHPEIGFLASRIMLKIKEYPIDLLLLEKGVLSELSVDTDQIECAVMLIPH